MKTISKLTNAFIGVLLGLLLMPAGAAEASSGTWANVASMPVARFDNTVAGIGNLLYAAGGTDYVCGVYSTLEVYDPITNTWTAKASMPTARMAPRSGVVNGILYVVGGTTGCITPTMGYMEAYDPATNTWSIKAPMPTPRTNFGVGVVNGTLYAVGGMQSGGLGILSTVEAYDPISNTWTTKAPLPTARYAIGVGVVNGVLYAVGGSDGISSSATINAYDPITNSWTAKTPMPTWRVWLDLGVVNGALYAVGGNSGDSGTASTISATVSAYNPVNDTWTTVSPMTTARTEPTVGVVDNILYVVGGYPLGGPRPIATVEAYAPNQPPVANAGADQNIYLGQTASFNGSASSDSNGDSLTYVWTLDSAPAGSATALVGANTATPSLYPDVAGVYHISLIVNDGMLYSAVSTVTINASQNLPPIAVATGSPLSGYAPLQVLFNSSASHDPENSVLTYSWNFGDPTSASNTSNLMNPIHAYAALGNYTAVVTVTDNLGKTDQASVAITVTAPNLPPVVSPTATPNNGASPLSVQFAANATDANPGDVLSYNWNFGDGSPVSTLANPQHSYVMGTYTATVQVSDGVNAPVSASLTISVSSALTINVTEAKVERGDKGKVEGKINMRADFNFGGMPAAGDIIMVKFDGITLLNVPFSSFRHEHSGEYEYESRTQEAEIDFMRKTIKVSSHKMLTGQVDNSNGIDVVIRFGTATGTDNFVMSGRKGDKGDKDDRDRELSHKRDRRHD